MNDAKFHTLFGLTRVVLGLIFLWAFFDKLMGLGFATQAAKSWIRGGSPTMGFLTMGTHGPFASIFQALAHSAAVDWLFMMGLLLIGFALVLGIGVMIAGYTGALLMFLMWLAALPPTHHPLFDEHIVYLLALLGFTAVPAGEWIGLGGWWSRTALVMKLPWLK